MKRKVRKIRWYWWEKVRGCRRDFVSLETHSYAALQADNKVSFLHHLRDQQGQRVARRQDWARSHCPPLLCISGFLWSSEGWCRARTFVCRPGVVGGVDNEQSVDLSCTRYEWRRTFIGQLVNAVDNEENTHPHMHTAHNDWNIFNGQLASAKGAEQHTHTSTMRALLTRLHLPSSQSVSPRTVVLGKAPISSLKLLLTKKNLTRQVSENEPVDDKEMAFMRLTAFYKYKVRRNLSFV